MILFDQKGMNISEDPDTYSFEKNFKRKDSIPVRTANTIWGKKTSFEYDPQVHSEDIGRWPYLDEEKHSCPYSNDSRL